LAEERVQRRLAAILAIDIVGYSRLMEADEARTLARLKALRAEILHPKVAEYGGRIFKTTGDGTLVEFPSAVDAVNHALDVQMEMALRNADLPEQRRLMLRMGINLGDIIIEGDDIYGDGVNIAARLESLAEPGGICLSGAVHEHVRGKVNAAFGDLGEQTVKNIARPIRVWRVRPTGDTKSQISSGASLPLPVRPSIAVLAFQNMSGDPEQEYFADGIAEDIITGLSRFRWLDVIARNSSFTFKGRNVDVRTIGRELGVRYVLEGSVRKAGQQLRITAQLVEAATGSHLWAERYDGALADVFDLQDKITEGVVGAIEPSVRKAEIERARRKRTENLDAYDFYLRALPHAWANTTEEAGKALALLDRALKIDPTYAAAHSIAAFCISIRARGLSINFGGEEAVRHARAALATNTDDEVALVYAGFGLLVAAHDRDGALAAVSRAMEINPNSPTVLGRGALVYAMSGAHETAIDLAQRSIRLSPHDPMRYAMENAICIAQFHRGRYAEAAETAQRTIKYNPHFGIGYAMLAACCVKLGRMDDAKDAARRVVQLEPGFRIETGGYWGPPDQAKAIADALREAGLPE